MGHPCAEGDYYFLLSGCNNFCILSWRIPLIFPTFYLYRCGSGFLCCFLQDWHCFPFFLLLKMRIGVLFIWYISMHLNIHVCGTLSNVNPRCCQILFIFFQYCSVYYQLIFSLIASSTGSVFISIRYL